MPDCCGGDKLVEGLDIKREENGLVPAGIRSYSIEEDNRVGVEIYHHLLEAFHECEMHCTQYLNIVAIFFHHLMQLLTGCVLKSSEIKHFMDLDVRNLKPLREFPYVGYYELATGHIDVRSLAPLSAGTFSRPRTKRLVNLLSKTLMVGRKRVALLADGSDVKYILKRLVLSGVRCYFETNTKVYIPKYREQLEILRRTIIKLALLYNINIRPDDLMEIVHHMISPFLDEKQKEYEVDLVLTGTILRPESRVVAARARSQGKPVITISHGEGDLLIVDEPRTGYGELTFPTTYVGYGPHGRLCIERAVYGRGLYQSPSFVEANSNICRELYRGDSEIKPLAKIENPVFMYVPTNFMGEKRYGPFHNPPDVWYGKWQERIAELFPEAIYKKHPKETVEAPKYFKRVVSRDFVECLGMADVFIFDVISTAFNIATATNKPIICFDIGVRNIHEYALRYIKGRTIWINARRDKDTEELKREIKNQENKTLVNAYTEMFCITDGEKRREETVADLVLEAIYG